MDGETSLSGRNAVFLTATSFSRLILLLYPFNLLPFKRGMAFGVAWTARRAIARPRPTPRTNYRSERNIDCITTAPSRPLSPCAYSYSSPSFAEIFAVDHANSGHNRCQPDSETCNNNFV